MYRQPGRRYTLHLPSIALPLGKRKEGGTVTFVRVIFVWIAFVWVTFARVIFVWIAFVRIAFVRVTFVRIAFVRVTFVRVTFVRVTFVRVTFVRIAFARGTFARVTFALRGAFPTVCYGFSVRRRFRSSWTLCAKWCSRPVQTDPAVADTRHNRSPSQW